MSDFERLQNTIDSLKGKSGETTLSADTWLNLLSAVCDDVFEFNCIESGYKGVEKIQSTDIDSCYVQLIWLITLLLRYYEKLTPEVTGDDIDQSLSSRLSFLSSEIANIKPKLEEYIRNRESLLSCINELRTEITNVKKQIDENTRTKEALENELKEMKNDIREFEGWYKRWEEESGKLATGELISESRELCKTLCILIDAVSKNIFNENISIPESPDDVKSFNEYIKMLNDRQKQIDQLTNLQMIQYSIIVDASEKLTKE